MSKKTMPNLKKQLSRTAFCRGTAAVMCVCYLMTFNSGSFLFAEILTPTQESTQTVLPASVGKLTIPPEFGSIEEVFEGSEKPIVFLIQDAHAVTDTQKNIQRLIAHFRETYGIRQVAVEGTAAPLDATLFRSFPDRLRLRRVFKDYLESGELTGPTAAAIFNTQPSHLVGAENWQVFEQGLREYYLAMKNLPKIEGLLNERYQVLKRRKEKIYSSVLLEVDLALNSFNEEKSDLATLLKKLASVSEPAKGSDVAVMLDEIRQEGAVDSGGIVTRVRKIADDIGHAVMDGKAQLSREKRGEYNRMYQEFQTGRIHAQAYALFLMEFLETRPELQRILQARSLSFLSEDPLKQLVTLSGHQKMLREIEGTKFFTELKDYAAKVKESLFFDAEARALDQESQELALLGRLSRLKLDHEDWDQIEQAASGLAEIHLEQLLKPSRAFYQNAKQRDQILFNGVQKRLKAADKANNGRPACLLVAGGFHTEGVTQLLRQHQISYAVLMPKITSLPAESVYQNQMRGQVSWSKYLKPENGAVDLNAAFVRAARDRLMDRHGTDAAGSKNDGRSNLQSPASAARLLKTWRDQIIRDLSAQGRLTEAAQYTRYLDEVQDKEAFMQNTFTGVWRANIHSFVSRLKQLDSRKQMTPDHVVRLLQPSALIPPYTANAIARSPRLHTRFGGVTPADSVRGAARWTSQRPALEKRRGSETNLRIRRSEVRGYGIEARTFRRRIAKSFAESDLTRQGIGILEAFYGDILKRFPTLDALSLLDRFKQIDEDEKLDPDDPVLAEILSRWALLERTLKTKVASRQVHFYTLQMIEQLARLNRTQVKSIEEKMKASERARTGLRLWIDALWTRLVDLPLRLFERWSENSEKKKLEKKEVFFARLDREGRDKLKKASKELQLEAHGVDALSNAFSILKSGYLRHSKGLQQTAPLHLLGEGYGPYGQVGLFVRSPDYDEKRNKLNFSVDGSLESFEVSLDQIVLIIFSAQVAGLMRQRFPDYADKIKSYDEAADWLDQHKTARSEVRETSSMTLEAGTSVTLTLLEDTSKLVSVDVYQKGLPQTLVIARINGTFSYHEVGNVRVDRVRSIVLPLNAEKNLSRHGLKLWTDGKSLLITNTTQVPLEVSFRNARVAAPAEQPKAQVPGLEKEGPRLAALQAPPMLADVLSQTRFSKEQSDFSDLGGPLTLDFLRQHGFEPAVEVNLPMPESGKYQKVYLAGRVVDLGKGRAFTLGYVEDLERVDPSAPRYVVRTYYRSNSAGGFWRLLPSVLMAEGSDKPAWYDKAFGEESITVEAPLLQAINNVIRRRGIETMTDENNRYLLFAGTGKRLETPWERLENEAFGRGNWNDSLLNAFDRQAQRLNVASDYYKNLGKKTPPGKSRFTDLGDKPVFAVEDRELERLGRKYTILSNLTDGVPDEVRMMTPNGEEPVLVSLETQRDANVRNQKMTTYSGTEMFFNGPGIVKRLAKVKRKGFEAEYEYEDPLSRIPTRADFVDGQGVRHSILRLSLSYDEQALEGNSSWMAFPDGTIQYFNDMGQLTREDRQGTRFDFNYGRITVREFDSDNGKRRYAFVVDKLGRAMIGAIWDLTAPRNAFGLRLSWVDGGSKTTPLYEYVKQALGYGDESDLNGPYIGMWRNYNSKLPIIQEFIRAFNIQQDADVFTPLIRTGATPHLDEGARAVPEDANSVFDESIGVSLGSAISIEVLVSGQTRIYSGENSHLEVGAKKLFKELTFEDLIKNPSFSFGRALTDQIYFSANYVSRNHGVLHFDFDEKTNQLTIRVTDNNSREGVFVGVERIQGSYSFAPVTLKPVTAEAREQAKDPAAIDGAPAEEEQFLVGVREHDLVLMVSREGVELAYEVSSASEYTHHLELQPLNDALVAQGERILYSRETLAKIMQESRGAILARDANGKLPAEEAEKAFRFILRKLGDKKIRRLLAARLDRISHSPLLNPRDALQDAVLRQHLKAVGASILLMSEPNRRGAAYSKIMRDFLREGEGSVKAFDPEDFSSIFPGDEVILAREIQERVRVLSRKVADDAKVLSFKVLRYRTNTEFELPAADIGSERTFQVLAVDKLTDRNLESGHYTPARSELRRLKSATVHQRAEVLKKTVLALRQPGSFLIHIHFNPDELAVLIAAAQETGSFERLESELTLQMDVLVYEAVQALMDTAGKNTQNNSQPVYTVGLVVPAGLDQAVLDPFLTGYISGLVGAVREVLLQHARSHDGGLIERIRASGLKVRSDFNPNRPAPELLNDQSGAGRIIVAALGEEAGMFHSDFTRFGVDLTANNILELAQNDPERLKLIGYLTARGQTILADLSKTQGLTPAKLKEELHKRLFQEVSGDNNLIEFVGHHVFQMNLGLIDQLVNDMTTRKAAAVAA